MVGSGNVTAAKVLPRIWTDVTGPVWDASGMATRRVDHDCGWETSHHRGALPKLPRSLRIVPRLPMEIPLGRDSVDLSATLPWLSGDPKANLADEMRRSRYAGPVPSASYTVPNDHTLELFV